ncbi:hypothetical protein [Chamaesiphon polymorphus]|nr:hypothetical protein [Chamaesiphon polymorphus]
MTHLNSPIDKWEKELNEALEALHFAFRAVVARKVMHLLAEERLTGE